MPIGTGEIRGLTIRTPTFEEEYATVPVLEAGLESYFMFYNHERPHQSLAYRTPAEVHWKQ